MTTVNAISDWRRWTRRRGFVLWTAGTAFVLPVSLFLAQVGMLGLTVHGLWRGARRWRRERVLWGGIALLLVAWVASWSLSPRGLYAFREVKDAWILLTLPALAAIRPQWRRVRTVLPMALAAGAVVAVLHGWVQVLWQTDLVRSVPTDWLIRGRATGFFRNPLPFAGVISLAAWLMAVMTLRPGERLRARFLWGTAFLLLLSGVALSGSRSYFLVWPALLLLVGAWKGLRGLVVAWGLLVILLGAGFVWLSSQPEASRYVLPTVTYTADHRYPAIITASTTSRANARIALTEAALRCLKDHPATGLGKGAAGFVAGITPYIEELNATHGLRLAPLHCHNNALQIAVETGLFGLFAAGVLAAILAWRWWRGFGGQCRGPTGWRGILGIGLTLHVLIAGLTEYNLGDLEFLLPLLLLTAFAWPARGAIADRTRKA